MEVSVLQAKTDFSKLLHLLEDKKEESIIVTRHNKPVAKITSYETVPAPRRIGIYKDLGLKSLSLEEFDRDNEEIAAMLMDGEL